MFTLIKREIEDNIIFFIIAVIIVFVSILITIYSGPMQSIISPIVNPLISSGIFVFLMPFLPFVCAALGATQTYSDRNKKISTFLSTLSTTRRRILTAKIITGLLWILVVLAPIVAADIILIKYFARVLPGDTDLFIKMITTTFLSSLACYTLGLQMGWNQNRFFPVLGSILLAPVLILVIVIKGFGIETAVIFLLFTAVLMIRTWQRFMATSL